MGSLGSASNLAEFRQVSFLVIIVVAFRKDIVWLGMQLIWQMACLTQVVLHNLGVVAYACGRQRQEDQMIKVKFVGYRASSGPACAT